MKFRLRLEEDWIRLEEDIRIQIKLKKLVRSDVVAKTFSFEEATELLERMFARYRK